MSSMKVTFDFPAITDPTADDVVSREFAISVSNLNYPAEVFPVTFGQPQHVELAHQFARGDAASMTITDIDGSGNRSPTPLQLNFTVTDTQAPPSPPAPTSISFTQV